MNKNFIVKPTGLKGKDKLNRIKELMSNTLINENYTNSSVEITKLGPDNIVYAIVREGHTYFIKTSNKKENLMLEDFKYIGGLQNKTSKAYPSYSKALKQLNLKFISLCEAYEVDKSEYNIFQNDNIFEHHPYKSDQKLSATKGMGDGAEYVIDKKGDKLTYNSKEGKEDGQFGDNVAEKDVDDEFEDVKLTENEMIIDSMLENDDADIFKDAKTIEDVEKIIDNNNINKGDLMKIAYGGNTRNIDAAIPRPYWEKLEEHGGTYWFVMDYQNNSHGKLVHLGEKILGIETNWLDKLNDINESKKGKFSILKAINIMEDIVNEDRDLRSVKVNFDNGDSLTTSMAKDLTDDEIKDYYKIGKSFNLGDGSGGDKMAKVKSVEILKETNAKKKIKLEESGHILNITLDNGKSVSKKLPKKYSINDIKKKYHICKTLQMNDLNGSTENVTIEVIEVLNENNLKKKV